MNASLSKVYVIRIWYEPSAGGEVWRASLSQGEERYYFQRPDELARFLLEESLGIEALEPSPEG